MTFIQVGGHTRRSKTNWAIVDEADYAALNQYKWYLSNNGYAVRHVYVKRVRIETHLMHRSVLATPAGMHTDHVNHNKLDNRRSNLRICTASQNLGNSSPKLRKPKGVFFDKQRSLWYAKIMIRRKSRFLGRFATVDQAIEAYGEAARDLFGPFAYQITR